MDNQENLNMQNEPPQNLPVDPAGENTVSQPPPIPQRPVYTPPVPTYAPPVPNFQIAPENKKKFSIFSVLVLIVAVIIIIGLAFLLYYYSTKNYQVTPVADISTNTETPSVQQPATPPVTPTNVVTFSVPDVLPAVQKSGNCWINSVAAARPDAWRCMVGSTIYDPCFETSQKGVVFCQMNPTNSAGAFLIKLTEPLPVIAVPTGAGNNWAWFVKLKDGTICSPFTGTTTSLNNFVGAYGCRPPDKNTQIVLGPLTSGQVWAAQEQTSEKQGTTWVEKSSGIVEIDSVWQ